MNPRVVAIAKRVIPIAFYVLLAVFLVLYIKDTDFSTLSQIDINWWLVAIATILSLSFRYWGVMIWFFLLKRLGAVGLRGKYVSLTYIYAKSWLGRYIPGAATWIVGKVYFASQHGVSRARLAVSGLLEGALQIVATLALSLVLLLLDARASALNPWVAPALIAAFVLCVVVLIPPVFERLLNLALKIIRRPPVSKDALPSTATLAWSALLYLGGACIAGVSYYFISAAIYPAIKPSDILFIVGAVSLASAVSLLAVFIPGGIGVREGVLIVLLAVVVPHSIALVIPVATRVWSIAVDGLFFLIAGGTNLAVRRATGSPEFEPVPAPESD